MAYKKNFTLQEFADQLRRLAGKSLDDEKYQVAAGLKARKAASKFLDGETVEEKTNNIPKWLECVRGFLGEFPEAEFERVTEKFNYNRTEYLIGKKSKGLNSALILHYRLHMYHLPDDLKLAEELDKEIIPGQKTFQAVVGKPVFEYDLREVYDAPPMNAPMSHPGYISSENVRRILKKDADDSIWLNPYNHSTLTLEGREEEMKRLTRFAEQDGMFRVLPVIAPSGAGKTRLISEWMRRYSPKTNLETKWEAGILSSDDNQNARDPKPWSEWEITRNTLIVIDYTYAFDEVVRAIAERAIHRKDGRNFKVRLIVIDHVMPKMLQDDFLWQKVASSKRIADQFRSAYLEPELILKSAGDKSKMLGKIITASAKVGGRDLSEHSQIIKDALAELDRMGKAQGERDCVRHPLFAALMGRALRDPGFQMDFSNWTRRDLVQQYFTGKDRLPWTTAQSEPGEIAKRSAMRGLKAGALVSAATLRRGLDRHEVKPLLNEDFEASFQVAQRIVSSSSPFEVGPFLPDILGETFLLKFLAETESRPEGFEKILDLLNLPGTKSAEPARNFRETIARLARNLSGDDVALTEVQDDWANLVRLLNPAMIAEELPLRTYVSFAIADVMESLAKTIELSREHEGLVQGYQTLLEKLKGQAEHERIFVQPGNEDLTAWTRTCFKFFEHSTEQKFVNEIVEVSRLFSQFNHQKWTAILLAALDGRSKVLRTVFPVLDENVNATVVGGWTAAMAASLNGHLEVLRYLKEDGGCDLNARMDDGWTAAMLASQN
ncbi:MAG: ankyrin repeat domain-containing protein, partial [Pseudomonadota bacterium]